MVTLSSIYGGRDVVHSHLRKYMLKHIMPTLFEKYKAPFARHHCYMVVIGGMSVERCANLSRASRRFIRDIFSEDIDIKCVFTKAVDGLEDKNVQKVNALRMEFLYDVIENLKLKIAKMQFDDGVSVHVELDDLLLSSSVETVRLSQVVGISIHYVEHQRRFETPILDTTLYGKFSAPMLYEGYKKVTKSKYPIPVVTINKVPYATCNYSYYETVRLFLGRIEYFIAKKSMYALMNFYRNVVKFMSLYVLRKHIKDLPPKMDKIYTEVHSALMKIDLIRIQQGFRKELSGIKYDETFVHKIILIMKEIISAMDVEDLIKTTVKEIQLKYNDDEYTTTNAT